MSFWQNSTQLLMNILDARQELNHSFGRQDRDKELLNSLLDVHISLYTDYIVVNQTSNVLFSTSGKLLLYRGGVQLSQYILIK